MLTQNRVRMYCFTRMRDCRYKVCLSNSADSVAYRYIKLCFSYSSTDDLCERANKATANKRLKKYLYIVR